VLENPYTALAPHSRICATTAGINADYGLKAHRKATDVGSRLLAESPSVFRRSLRAAAGIVIDRKIRVFQHNPSIPVVPEFPWKDKIRPEPMFVPRHEVREMTNL
jgi:hypothetical protein